MHRSASIILALLLLLVGIAATGLHLARRLSPEQLRAETQRWLSDWLEAPVEVGSVRPVFHRGVALEVVDIRSGLDSDGPGLRADGARLALDLRGFLFGGAPLRRIEVRGAVIRIERDAEGSWHPFILHPPRDPAPDARRTAPRSALTERAAEAVRLLLNAPTAIPSIALEGARVEVRIAQWGGADHGPGEWALDGLELQLARRLFRGGLRVRARGEAIHPGGARGDVQLQGDLSPIGGLGLRFDIDGFDLGLLTPLVAMALPGSELGGQARGALFWRVAASGAHDWEGTLDLAALSVQAADSGAPWAAPPELQVRFEAEASDEAVTIRDLHLRAGTSELRAGGRWGLPLAPDAETFLALRAWRIPLTAVRDALVPLLAPSHPLPLARRLLEGVGGGELTELMLKAPHARLADWERFVQSPLEAWPEGLELEIELAGAALELPGSATLSELGARLVARRNRLELEDARASLDGEPLPRLDLSLEGLRHLHAIRGEAVGAAAGLPGRIPLQAWLARQGDPDGERSWSQAALDIDWIDHPLLGWPLEEASLSLRPLASRGLGFELSQARWGGIPVWASGRFVGEVPGHVLLSVRVSAPDMPAPMVPAENEWARGRFRADVVRVGRFASETIAGELSAVGEVIRVSDGVLELTPRGRIEGELDLDLGGREAAAFEARLQVVDGVLADLLEALGVRGSGLDGNVVAAMQLRGRIQPELRLVRGLSGPLSVHARDGSIRRRLPVVIALAEASDTLNPLASREFTPYRAVDAQLELDGGRLTASSLSLDGPTLRLVATGSVEVADPPHALEAVVGVFFFRKLDAMIDKVPVLNRLLLGADENFVAAYFALSGPWEGPDARFIPAKSLAAGPGSLVVVGLPAFVRGGLHRLQNLVVGGWRAGGEVSAPEGAP